MHTVHTAHSKAPGAYMQGILLMIAGVACLSANDAIAKALTADYSPCRSFFCAT